MFKQKLNYVSKYKNRNNNWWVLFVVVLFRKKNKKLELTFPCAYRLLRKHEKRNVISLCGILKSNNIIFYRKWKEILILRFLCMFFFLFVIFELFEFTFTHTLLLLASNFMDTTDLFCYDGDKFNNGLCINSFKYLEFVTFVLTYKHS